MKCTKGNSYPIFILLLGLLPVLFYAGMSDACRRSVVVKTDKSTYTQSEAIEITLSNNLKESIWSHIGSETPVFAIKHFEIKGNGTAWDTLYARCIYPECIYDSDAPAEITAGSSRAFVWLPRVYINGSPEYVTPEPGRYRLLIIYMNAAMNEWNSEYSPIFQIE
jgi:hypothetical protein